MSAICCCVGTVVSVEQLCEKLSDSTLECQFDFVIRLCVDYNDDKGSTMIRMGVSG